MAELLPCPFYGESELLEVETIDHGEEKRPFGFRWTAKNCLLELFCFLRNTRISTQRRKRQKNGNKSVEHTHVKRMRC